MTALYRSAGPSAAALLQVIPASSSAAAEKTDRAQKRSGGGGKKASAAASVAAAAAAAGSASTVATVPDEEKGAATVTLSTRFFRCVKFFLHVFVVYRVFHQVADVGWVYLDLGCFTVFPNCSAISAQAESGR